MAKYISGQMNLSLILRRTLNLKSGSLGAQVTSTSYRPRMDFSDAFSGDGLITIAASVATGLENVAANEVREKLHYPFGSTKVKTSQGRVYFITSKECLATVHKLRSVDRLYLVIKTQDFIYKDTKEEVYADLTKLANEIQWKDMLKIWDLNKPYCKPKYRQENMSKKRRVHKETSEANRMNDCCGDADKTVIVSKDNIDESLANLITKQSSQTEKSTAGGVTLECNNGIPASASDGTLIRFRVSTNRVGKKQPITSPEASYRFGGEIQDITKWKVDLSYYNLEIMLCLGEKSLEVSIALTLQSLHRRNITHFGVTTLRATTAYCMLRMCDIKPGEIVIDPMCGSGAIPVEAALEWPYGFHIGGDEVRAAVTRCSSNIQFLKDNPEFSGRKISSQAQSKRKDLRTDVLRWDATALPIKSDYVDVIVSDLPFGKRIGSKVDNRKLYPALLCELARIARCGSARACLLTQDKRTMKRALDANLQYWKLKTNIYINIGGLTAGVFLIQRTKNPFKNTSESI